MSFYLCVDCGGSKTSAVVCDSAGKVRGRALGGPSNFANLDVDAFTSSVRESISNALNACSPSSSVSTHTFAAAWFGVSGVDSPAAIASITPILSALVGIPPGPRLLIENDTHLLAAPVSLYPDVSHCIACIAGTGSICMSFVEAGGRVQQIGRVGGWGWLLGDEGGGFHVGREAIRQLLALADADTLSLGAVSSSSSSTIASLGKRTLKTRVLKHFEITDIYEILRILYLPDPPAHGPTTAFDTPSYTSVAREKRLSSLCPLVFSSAFDDGDQLALNVLRTCADFLASQIVILLSPADDVAGSSSSLARAVKANESVICFGGSLVAVDAYRRMVLDNLAQRGFVFKYVQVVNDAAAAGAIGLAAFFKNTGGK